MVAAPHEPPATSPPLLAAYGVTKRFPGVVANDRVSLELHAGEVHALLGENGAGKTTLISMLYGFYPPDEGTLYLFGEPLRLRSPRDALARGVGLVAQHFLLVPRHTVAENVALGLPGTPFWGPTRRLKARIRELSARYGLQVDPDAYVQDLSAGEQQRVEILKALVRGARVLILDEPTGVLTPGEAEGLFEMMAAMKREGHAVVFITHKLGEVMRAADRVTVLRKGRVVGHLSTAETNAAALARLMVGREVSLPPLRAAAPPGERLLEVQGLCARGERGEAALKGVSFELHAGEMLGVAGVAGNGQRELIEVLTGLRAATAGTLRLRGRDLTPLSPRERFEAGVAHIPEERLGTGVVPSLSVADNLSLRHYRTPPFARGPLVDRAAVAAFAARVVEHYRVATPSLATPVRLLSGGNIQKLILGRELHGDPTLIVAAHPTYGLDVGATELTHRRLAESRARGAGVLLVSEDLDELLRLCDRIVVLFAGEVMGALSAEDAPRDLLGLMMAGAAHA
jgi:ABC-type uncharacterized transport system ATPase subunit